MDQERWQQVDRLFEAALELPSGERAAFLDEACAGDAELRKEVESLVAHDKDVTFMETPASEEVARLLAPNETGSLNGQTIGPYKVFKKLGAGGMGEVYLALHTRTNRQVALKVLPAFHAKDKERVRRFQQEAAAVLALNHPNIVTIYDIEQAGEVDLIASEYIEGETLHRRMARAPLRAQEAIDIALQVAAALAAAHQAGVVHRDIKPENIMLRPDGYLKVLDFGLAKLPRQRGLTADSNAPTKLELNTQPGMVLGTVNYMSPEQARGLRVDERTDIFSFGVVLYEMLTGHLPFAGETKSDVMAAILQTEPPALARYWPGAPDALEWIVARTLAKDKDERYQTAKELLADLKRLRRRLDYEAEAERSASTPGNAASLASGGARLMPGTVEKTTSSASRTAGRSMSSVEYLVEGLRRHRLAALYGSVALASVLAGGAYLFHRLTRTTATPRAPFQRISPARLTNTGEAVEAAISPDGEFVVYVREEAGRQSLWLRQTSTNSSVQIAPPVEGQRYGSPLFSPDGAYIYYLTAPPNNFRASLHRMAKLGGDERKVTDDIGFQDTRNNFSLSPDGRRLAFVRLDASFNRALVTTDLQGGDERTIAARKLPDYVTGAAWSPDGQTVATLAGAFGSRKGAPGPSKVLVLRLSDGAQSELAPEGWVKLVGLSWLSDSKGLIVSASHNYGVTQLWHLSYPEGVARRVTNDLSDYDSVSLTTDSSLLAAVQVNTSKNIWTAPLDGSGEARQLTNGVGRHDGQHGVAWMPDGRIVYHSLAGGGPDIWIMNGDGSGQKQLTSGGINTWPAVTPDGRYILFTLETAREPPAIWRMDADGANQRRIAEEGIRPYSSPDGQWVVYYAISDLRRVPVDGGPAITLPKPAKDVALAPVVSPDGKLIACTYIVGQPGAQFRIAVVPFEGGEPVKVFDIISHAMTALRWTPDSRALLYAVTREGVSNIWRLPLDGGPPVQMTDFKTHFISYFDWSSEGGKLALSRGTVTSDVILIRDMTLSR